MNNYNNITHNKIDFYISFKPGSEYPEDHFMATGLGILNQRRGIADLHLSLYRSQFQFNPGVNYINYKPPQSAIDNILSMFLF